MSEPLRCGIVGFDFGHQGAFAGSLAKMPEVTIAGAADLPDAPDEARARGREFAQRCGAPYFEDYADLLAAEDLDMVSLCISPARNPDLVEEMCARGIHVMSEKPVSADTAGVQRIAKAVRAAGVRFTFGFHAARFTPPVSRAVAQVRSGAVGQVRVLNGMFLQSKGPRYTIPVEEARRRRAAGEPSVGELANFGGYVFLAMRALAGAPVRSVYAETDAFFYESYRIAGIEDMALVTLEFKSGAVGTVIVGRTTTKSLPNADVRYEVIGSEGVLHVDFAHGDRMFVWGDYRDDDGYERGGLDMMNFSPPSYELYCADFVRAIIEGREPELTVDDALEFDAFLSAAYESARTHRPVALG
ncbi:MAG: Gfo/Idh/MocA family oxidoreductase [Armatimonadetes bacterium]|nr:Gfo/Idh/MocA family oxidoreductase [Armatimonadota bacterium]